MLKLKRIGIDSGHYNFALINGFAAQNLGIYPMERIEVVSIKDPSKKTVVIVDVASAKSGVKIERNEIMLYEDAFRELDIDEDDEVEIHPIPVLESFESVKAKWEGKRFSKEDLEKVIDDISHERYSEPLTTYFLLACAKEDLTDQEIAYLTMGLVKAGDVLKIDSEIVADKHCIGGIPNNRTTPIVIPICAAAGLKLPNTFTKAITSSAATADVIGTYIHVSHSIEKMKEITEKVGACLVWGGSVDIAPGDDVLIQIQRPLNIDSESQMIGSILAKKVGCGVTHLLLDIPYGKEAKATNLEDAKRLKRRFERVAKLLDLNLKVVITSGEIPVGKRIGCVGEMMDVLEVLQNKPEAPQDLKERSLFLAGELLEFAKVALPKQGINLAKEILESGKAYNKLMEIRDAQGGKEMEPLGKYSFQVFSEKSGEILDIDNAIIKKINKASGAPFDVGATIVLERNYGDHKGEVKKGDLLYTVLMNNEKKVVNVKKFIEEKGNGFVIV